MKNKFNNRVQLNYGGRNFLCYLHWNRLHLFLLVICYLTIASPFLFNSQLMGSSASPRRYFNSVL